jgi:hypothetical protein
VSTMMGTSAICWNDQPNKKIINKKKEIKDCCLERFIRGRKQEDPRDPVPSEIQRGLFAHASHNRQL